MSDIYIQAQVANIPIFRKDPIYRMRSLQLRESKVRVQMLENNFECKLDDNPQEGLRYRYEYLDENGFVAISFSSKTKCEDGFPKAITGYSKDDELVIITACTVYDFEQQVPAKETHKCNMLFTKTPRTYGLVPEPFTEQFIQTLPGKPLSDTEVEIKPGIIARVGEKEFIKCQI